MISIHITFILVALKVLYKHFALGKKNNILFEPETTLITK